MSNTKEIKGRIKSVRDTQKITNAMYLIASTKMRKAKMELEKTRPYFDSLQEEIERLFDISEKTESRYFYPYKGVKEIESYAILVITADKGLAGAYNHNVLKLAEEAMDKHKNSRLYVVGEYGRQYFRQRHVEIEKSFLYTAQNPTLNRAREIAQELIDVYDRGEADKIIIVYTDLKKNMEGEPRKQTILPLKRETFMHDGENKAADARYEFVPSLSGILDNVVKSYITGFIYGALVDSFCSEQNARMTAMDSANRNAENILEDLSVMYNRVRQAAITQEITEVSAGAKAQRLKRMKKRLKEANTP